MIHTVKSREYKHIHNFAYSKMKKHELLVTAAIKLGLVEDESIKKKNVKIPKKEISNRNKGLSKTLKEMERMQDVINTIQNTKETTNNAVKLYDKLPKSLKLTEKEKNDMNDNIRSMEFWKKNMMIGH